VRFLVAIATAWRAEKVSRLSASISFYALLSLIPLLITSYTVLGLVFDTRLVSHHVDAQIAAMLGQEQAQAVGRMLERAQAGNVATWQALLGALATFVTAAGVFIELKDSLNSLWHVRAPEHPTWWTLVRSYFAPLTMVLGFGFLLLVSLVLSAVVASLSATLAAWQPGLAAALSAGDWLASGVVAALLFAAIFRFLPDAPVAWRHVWLGALVTAAMHTLGRTAIGFYLGTSDFSGHYGPAGAIVAIVVWIYYSAQILFVGVLITRLSSGAPLGEARPPVQAPT
jgi:membrane protein